jgi:predicted HTH transcriptional regulator
MNPPDITTLLNMSESDSLDFKSGHYKFWNPSTDEEKSELLKDIIAFANSFKTGDAFIVVGVSEKNQRKDQVVGVTTHLKDNEVQQFVNSKTNRRVAFLVHSSTAEGQPIDIIQIAQKQERPICLTKNYGKVKANEVWIRVGSSSAIATPEVDPIVWTTERRN